MRHNDVIILWKSERGIDWVWFHDYEDAQKYSTTLKGEVGVPEDNIRIIHISEIWEYAE